MNDLIRIGNHEITTKEFQGKRVVTFKDIDLVHERPEGTARKRFNDNKEHFVEGEDFYRITPSEFRTTIGSMDSRQQNDITLVAEQGYLMLVKSFTDDLAWNVQRQLVNSYFKEQQKSLSPLEQMKLQGQALLEVDAKVVAVDKDLQQFKQDMPILGIEEGRITDAVRRKGVWCLGGKASNAYHDKSLRGKVYADIYGQLKREFGVGTYKAIKRSQCDIAVGIINDYELPFILADEVSDLNNQFEFDDMLS